MLLASRYKGACKLTFFVQLLLGWASVVAATLSENLVDTFGPGYDTSLYSACHGDCIDVKAIAHAL